MNGKDIIELILNTSDLNKPVYNQIDDSDYMKVYSVKERTITDLETDEEIDVIVIEYE